MNIGDYVRTKNEGIGKIIEIVPFMDETRIFLDNNKGNRIFQSNIGTYKTNDEENIIKSSSNIIDLLQPMDLIYVDIDDNYAGGIIVPRIAETPAELNLMIDLIKSGKWILKGVVTNEQLDSMEYKVGD